MVLTLQPLGPTIRLSSDLAVAQVLLDGQPVGKLEDGAFELELETLSSGEHTLTVSNRGSKATMTFETVPGSPVVLRRAPEARNLRLAVVTSLGSQARVYSDVELAEASLDDESLSAIGPEGLELRDLEQGTHELELGAGRNLRRIVFESNSKPTVTAFLQSDPDFGGLRIETGENDVDVYINGRKYRRPTKNGHLLVYLYPNRYQVRVEKTGFRAPPEQTVAVRKGARARLSLALARMAQRPKLRVWNSLLGREVALAGSPGRTIRLNGGLLLRNAERDRPWVQP